MPAATRRLTAIAAAVALVSALPGTAIAAVDGIKETSKTTYAVLPAEGRVHVESSITLKNQKKPKTSKGPCDNNPNRTCKTTITYYADGWGPITVPPDAVEVEFSGKGVQPVPVGVDESGTAYAVQFPRLNYKKKQRVDVAYDLPDSTLESAQLNRVNDAYARLCWRGEATDTGATTLKLPAGWDAATTGTATTTAAEAGGTTVKLKSKKDGANNEACTDAFDAAAMVWTHLIAPAGQIISLSAWPGDPEWAGQAATVIREGLPALEATLGSPMPFASLTIQQVARVNDFGLSTDLDVNAARLFLDEGLDFEAAPLATFARTWFEDGSIGDPWLKEGLALWAGLTTAGYECPDPGTYPGSGNPDLLDWQVGKRIVDEPGISAWQALAACQIVEDAAVTIGPERMADVITSLRDGTPRYGDRATTTAQREPATWTDWLDAVDELGLVPAGETDLSFAERTLQGYGVATTAALTGRSTARALYHEMLAGMDGTGMPAWVDGLMESWSFADAPAAILEAKRVYDGIAEHPTLTDDARGSFTAAFEAAPSAQALNALEGAIAAWVPATIAE